MSWIMVDIEADGPIPGDFSMIEIGAVIIDKEGKLDKTFYGKLKPISNNYSEEALKSIGLKREDTFVGAENPDIIMLRFYNWIRLNSKDRHMFISDNNGFDWMFVCWYFQHFIKMNPFGFSSSNLGSMYKGLVKNVFKNFKHLRQTRHSHHPVEDAIGNAEALLYMINKMGLNIKL